MDPRTNRRPRLSPALAWTGAAAWYAAILLLTLPARVAEEMPPIPHFDKAAHFVAFAGQAVWLGLALGPGMAAWSITAALGALDEGLQTFAPGRSCELADWLADAAGAAAALAVWRLRRRPTAEASR